MSGLDFVAWLEADSAALAAAARSGGLDAPVPTCGDWRMADLVAHVFVIHRWVEEMVRTRSDVRRERDTSAPSGSAVVDAFEERAAALAATLRAAGLDTPVWNWSVDRPHESAFWHRRMSQETAVHRWDAQHAAGCEPSPAFDAALAADGVDELVDVFLRAGAAWFPDRTLGGSMHLHGTDGAGGSGDWLVSFGGGSFSLSRGDVAGDATARAAASDLLLFAWNRPVPPGAVETSGSEDVLAAWRAITL